MSNPQAGVRVDGLPRLRRALKELGDDLGDLKDANAKAAQIVAAEASQRAPHRSGALAGSGRGNRAAGRATVTFGGARVPYAAPIHYGWAEHGITAHPFVFDAAQATEPEWLDAYSDDIDAQLAKVTGRY